MFDFFSICFENFLIVFDFVFRKFVLKTFWKFVWDFFEENCFEKKMLETFLKTCVKLVGNFVLETCFKKLFLGNCFENFLKIVLNFFNYFENVFGKQFETKYENCLKKIWELF